MQEIIVAGCISFIVAMFTSGVTIWIYKNKTLTESNAVGIARRLLKSNKYPYRTFDELSRRVGGFEDNELRKILVRAGAIRFYKRFDDVFLDGKGSLISSLAPDEACSDAVEVWGLLSKPEILGIAMDYGTFPIEHGVKGMSIQTN